MNDIDARADLLIAEASNIIDNKIDGANGEIIITQCMIDGLIHALKGYGIHYVKCDLLNAQTPNPTSN